MKQERNITRRSFLKGLLAGGAGLALAGVLGPEALRSAGAGSVRLNDQSPLFDLERRIVRLSNGMDMPILGLGTYTLMNRVAEGAVYEALTAGYRLIDTAAGYGNERGVGQGVQRAGVPREDIFLTTKLWPTNVAISDIDHRLELLEMEYVDLLLLHQPDGDFLTAYHTMEQAVRQGKVRALGLSNFSASQVEAVLREAEIPPVLLQVETHLHCQRALTSQYLAGCNMVHEGWSPLGGRPNTPLFLQDETVLAIAADHGKTAAQVIIRWHLQRERVCIPGSGNADHIRENAQVFDFSLSPEEMARLDALDQNAPYFPDMGGNDEDTRAVLRARAEQEGGV